MTPWLKHLRSLTLSGVQGSTNLCCQQSCGKKKLRKIYNALEEVKLNNMSQLRDVAFNIKPPHPGPGSARLSRTPAKAEPPLPAAERASSEAACSAASQSQKQGPCELLGNALPRELPYTSLQHLDQHSECWRSQACRDLWLHSIRSGNTPEMRSIICIPVVHPLQRDDTTCCLI